MPATEATAGGRTNVTSHPPGDGSDDGWNYLVLVYTLRCPLSCDFCCYDCHPKRTETMPVALALRLVDEGADLGVFHSIGFTGGEVMLCFDELLAIADRCHQRSLPFTIATAGHWATSPEEADRRISQLANRGLIRLNLSHDPSHARFVPRERIANAARAGIRHGVPTYIVGTFRSPQETLEDYAPELTSIEGVHFLKSSVAPIGRASARRGPLREPGTGLALETMTCNRRVRFDLVVFPDGRAWPCCSVYNRATPALSVGNAHEDGLRTIWERAEGSLMFRAMKRQGFGRLYEIVQEYDPSLRARLPEPKGVDYPCAFCHELFGNQELAYGLKRVFREYERDRTSRAVEALEEAIGPEATARLIREILSVRS